MGASLDDLQVAVTELDAAVDQLIALAQAGQDLTPAVTALQAIKAKIQAVLPPPPT